jgi:Mg/Co/Ni transporter MgtE
MIKKEVFTGLFIGLAANCFGVLLVTFVLSLVKKAHFTWILNLYYTNQNLWMLICLGATFNLIFFYYFLQKKKYYRARGVLSATFIAAITSYLIYFL